MTMLVMINILNIGPIAAYSIAIVLHASSAAAPLLMFRREFTSIVARLPTISRRLHAPRDESDYILRSLTLITLVSAAVAIPLYFLAREALTVISGNSAMLIVGIALAATGAIQMLPSQVQGTTKKIEDLSTLDLILVGLAQGLSILPGISRSGLSVTALLLRKLDKEAALKLSFVVSVPLIAGAVILDLLEGGGSKMIQFIGLTDAVIMMTLTFLASVLSMEVLIRVARMVNFALFLMIFGCLTSVASLAKMLLGL